MKNMTRQLLLAAALLGGAGVAALAQPAAGPLACGFGVGEDCADVVLTQSGCGAIAAQVARAEGGEVIGAPKMVQQGNQTVCIITILVRDPSGERPPERRQVAVPAG